MPSKGNKTRPKEDESSVQQEARTPDSWKVGLFKKIMNHLQASQHTVQSHPKIIKELKKLYYGQTDPDLVKDYQKYFFSLIWNAMVIPFKETKCPAQERMVKVFTAFALEAGTAMDVEEYEFPIRDLPPFYTYIVRIFKNNHADIRPLVRLRLIELIYEILKEKHRDGFFLQEKVKYNVRINLLERSKDKHPPVRSVAFKCFAFIEVDPEQEVLKRLKFHADFDPHADVRKSALVTLVTITQPRPSFIVRKAFDLNDGIRIEAFKALVMIPFSKLKDDQRYKIIQWGLMQPVGAIKKIVAEELLPAWIADEVCGNNVVEFLCKLDISSNPSTAQLLFQALIPDDSEETFEKIDLGFLDDKKLVPIAEMSVEKVIYWRYTCAKFKHRPYCVQKIIPEAGFLIAYIEQIIEGIHKECERAATENVEDEEIEHILCLSHILRIAEHCDYEEGSRRSMETLLGKILRDQMLDEAVVIYTAVDVAHKVVEKAHFNNFMIEILQGIFEIDEWCMDVDEEVQGRTIISEMSSSRISHTLHAQSGSASPVPQSLTAPQINKNPERSWQIENNEPMEVEPDTCSDSSMRDVDPDTDVHGDAVDNIVAAVEGSPVVAEEDSKANPEEAANAVEDKPDEHGSENGAPGDLDDCNGEIGSEGGAHSGSDSGKENVPVPSALPVVSTFKTKFRADELVKLKSERATLIAQRHRLLIKKEAAIKASDFEGAQSIHNEIEAIKGQESMIKNQIEQNELNHNQSVEAPEIGRNDNRSQLMSPILHAYGPRRSLLSPPVPEVTPEHSAIPRSRISFAVNSLNKSDSSEIDELQGTLSRTVVSLANSLRGVVILTRYLTWQNELNLYVRTMYDNHILSCLEDKDYRLRMYAMYLICIVGMIDKSEARKSMAVMIQGLTPHEVEAVETASFKGLVDLLLQYNFSVFRAVEDDDDYAGDLPYPLNDPNISTKQMEEFFVAKLKSFATEEEKEEETKITHLSIKVLGFIKLLLRDRINDEDVIAWLLCIWAELKYTGTPICFNISYWIPVYASMGPTHALGMGKAFVRSVKNILSKVTEVGEDSGYDLMKLSHLIISNTGTRSSPPSDSLDRTVHEEIALLLLDAISHTIDHPHGLVYVQILKMLDFETQQVTIKIRKKIKDIVQTADEFPDQASKRLKITLRSLETQLTKRFGPLETDDMESDSDEMNEGRNERAKLNEEIGQLNIDPQNGARPVRESMVFQQGNEILNSSVESKRPLTLPTTRVARSSSTRRSVKSKNAAVKLERCSDVGGES